MAVLTGSVEADVPIQFADREWSEFVWRSLYGNFARGFEEDASAINETDADSGTVTFQTEGDRLVKVTVEVDYTPRSRSDPDGEVHRAQARLDRDLAKYRDFLLHRCEQEDCRAS
jgi:hypothetical protein